MLKFLLMLDAMREALEADDSGLPPREVELGLGDKNAMITLTFSRVSRPDGRIQHPDPLLGPVTDAGIDWPDNSYAPNSSTICHVWEHRA